MAFIPILVLFLSLAQSSFAAQLTYHDQFDANYWISTDTASPKYWAQLYFPDSQVRGSYGAGLFEYDNYVGSVENLKIILRGDGDNSSYPIDIFLAYGNSHSAFTKVASYNVPNNVPFSLTLDILNNDLLLNGSDVGNLSNVNLASFVGFDTFWVGYGCHFWHRSTEVDVGVNSVPEPATLIMLISGLIGVIAFRTKI